MKNWIVVANARRARILEQADEPARPGRRLRGATPFVHVADLVHTASRLKGSELASDRPGRVTGMGHGLGSARYEPRTDPRERERDRFALEVARALDAGVADGRCGGLTLIAPNPFMGRLKHHLGVQALKSLLRTETVDCTRLDDLALEQRLAELHGAAPGAEAA